MKNLIATVLLVAGISAYAQEAPTKDFKKHRTERHSPEQRNEIQMKKMTAELDLTSDQQQKLSQLLSQRNAKAAEMKNDRKSQREEFKKMTDAQKDAFKKQRKAEREVYDARLKNILNDSQFEKWQQIKSERKQKHGKQNKMKREKRAVKK